MKNNVNLEFNGDAYSCIANQSFVPTVGSKIFIKSECYKIVSMCYYYDLDENEDMQLECISFTVERY